MIANQESLEPEDLDRLLGDADLLLQLQLSGYASKVWDPIAAEFARWLASKDVIDDLAGMTIVLALQYFRDKVLKANKWDPAKGASLRTFFIGQFLCQFLNVYKVWLRDEQEHRALQQVVDADADDCRSWPAASARSSTKSSPNLGRGRARWSHD